MKEAIEYLLFGSDVTNYQISKATGISQPALFKYTSRKSDIENMTFGNALKLYEFYKEMNKVEKFKAVGRWWSNKEIELVEIDGKVYALDGWNGESYTNGWECTGEGYTDASEQQYSITPIYEDDELVAYEVD